MSTQDRIQAFKNIARERILILDGAMGTVLQRCGLEEDDYRGERFKDHTQDLKGNADVLNLTRPEVIAKIHRDFLNAGADILETNTFNSTSISQSEYGLQDYAYEISKAGAELARNVADEVSAQTAGRICFVAGSMGPTNKTLSVSPEISDPAYRAISFDAMRDAYKEQARGLLDGGADYLLVETIFDTLNAKATIVAVEELSDELGYKIPISLSMTVTDLSGRTLSGQTVEGFWNSIRHAQPLTVGMNCAFGANDLRPFIAELSAIADTLICAYPNAGLPDEMGEYTETPEMTASELEEWASSGFLNVVGGCCGTTPDHIRAIATKVARFHPRAIPAAGHTLRLSGLEPLNIAS